MPSIEDLCDKYLVARAKRDELKDQLDAAKKELDKVEAKLASTMIDSDENKVSHDGFTFTSSMKVSWKVKSDDKDKLTTLLKKGAPELVKETVNAVSLASFLRKNEESLESEGAKWWASAKKCLKREESESLSVRKAAKKKKKK
jgi:hypothetical protein